MAVRKELPSLGPDGRILDKFLPATVVTESGLQTRGLVRGAGGGVPGLTDDGKLVGADGQLIVIPTGGGGGTGPYDLLCPGDADLPRPTGLPAGQPVRWLKATPPSTANMLPGDMWEQVIVL